MSQLRLIAAFLLILVSGNLKATEQNRLVDSLITRLNSCTSDSCRIKLLSDLAGELRIVNLDRAEKYAHQALALAEKSKAIKYIATVNNSLGNIYKDKGRYNDAMKHFLVALKIAEERNDKKSISASYINISNIHYFISGHRKALEYLDKALRIKRELNDEKGIAGCLNNIANIHFQHGNADTALLFFDESLKIRTRLGNKQGISATLTNMAGVYIETGQPSKALPYFEKAMSLKREIGDSLGLVSALINAGSAYRITARLDESFRCYQEALAIAKIFDAKDDLKHSYMGLSDLYSLKGNYKEAWLALKSYIEINDSIFTEDIAKAQAEMSTKYETEKKEQEITLLNKDKLLRVAELNQQKTYKNLILSVSGLISLLAGVLFFAFRQKQKTNQVLSLQKEEIEEKNAVLIIQKEEIESQKNEITDSINYAKRIQESILPAVQEVISGFAEGFVLYNPKDIVSGDFYWAHTGKERKLIASVDCTGHGVPGALMSMIAAEKLHEAAGQIENPGEILSLVNRNVRYTLKQDTELRSTRDGMDIALIAVDLNQKKVFFSGANRPLWIFRQNGGFEEIKGNKQSLGGHTESDTIFEEHEISVSPGDQLYLFSDGFQDQFGGSEGKKLMKKNFKQLITNFRATGMELQEKNLQEFFLSWKGNHEQVDDILVIGLKI